MLQLWLIRHAETDWNIHHRFQGSSDQPLNANGESQARNLSVQLDGQDFDAIYTSDLIRVQETARLAGIQTAKLESRLREISFGMFEGLTYAEIKEQHPVTLAEWEKDRTRNPHGGDTLEDVEGRVRAFYDELRVEHPDERVLVFAHGGTLGILIALALGAPAAKWWQFRLDNTSVTELHLHEWGTILVRFNDTTHLNLR